MATDWSPFLHLIYNHNSLFSGIKTFHELNEAFPSILDEEGKPKPFESFLNDVQSINNTYNGSYLRTEYNFARNSSLMAAKWKAFEADGDRYNLQYRTAGDERVRASHQRLNNITLPITSKFWDDYLPPNGYGCRCTVVQVRKGKYPLSDEQEALNLASQATAGKHQEMMKFNPGKEMTTFPAYNAYTRSKCKNCTSRPGNISLAADIPDNELCKACEIVSKCAGDYTRSLTAIRKTHYMREMEPLLKKKVEKMVEGKLLKIGFSKDGNGHLYSDALSRSKILQVEDLKDLDKVLEKSIYVDKRKKNESHKNPYEEFYYFESELHQQKIRINVGKLTKRKKNGQISVRYICYSINDIK
ncbi:MAG: phage head morphogenesis protein [Bacteroidales bacterium]|nr:phage head morphogenesis protein [Bacteroidales bacterium]